MKTRRPTIISLATGLLALSVPSLHAQGVLTPPGPPGPTMKSLDQIEARTPISSAPFIITNSGSYYLTTNLTATALDTNAIIINTNGVTLDLNGYTISSTSATAAGTAILFGNPAGNRDITLLNGHIQGGVTDTGFGTYSSGPGFQNGIYGTNAINARVTGVTISGCSGIGIYLYNTAGTGDSTVVDNCTVRTMAGYGIEAFIVKNSAAYDCGNTAITCFQVVDSMGTDFGSSGFGIRSFATAQNCYGYSAGIFGIEAVTAQNCDGNSPTGGGVEATTAINCNGSGNTYGIEAQTVQNSFGAATDFGISATIVSGSYGSANTGGTGIKATVATACVSLVGSSESDTGITHAYNMP